MSVTPLDSTDQRIIRLVSRLGNPAVETKTVANELSIGQKEARFRLDLLEDNGWVTSEVADERRHWNVSSKASMLLPTDADENFGEVTNHHSGFIEDPSEPGASENDESE